jgi:hypothetical protein
LTTSTNATEFSSPPETSQEEYDLNCPITGAIDLRDGRSTRAAARIFATNFETKIRKRKKSQKKNCAGERGAKPEITTTVSNLLITNLGSQAEG